MPAPHRIITIASPKLPPMHVYVGLLVVYSFLWPRLTFTIFLPLPSNFQFFISSLLLPVAGQRLALRPIDLASQMCCFLFFSPLMSAIMTILRRSIPNPQNKINHHRDAHKQRQNRRSKPIIKSPLTPKSNTSRSPMVRHQRVDHTSHSDGGKKEGGNEGGTVTEV